MEKIFILSNGSKVKVRECFNSNALDVYDYNDNYYICSLKGLTMPEDNDANFIRKLEEEIAWVQNY